MEINDLYLIPMRLLFDCNDDDDKEMNLSYLTNVQVLWMISAH
jgi:hypothetical protein